MTANARTIAFGVCLSLALLPGLSLASPKTVVVQDQPWQDVSVAVNAATDANSDCKKWLTTKPRNFCRSIQLRNTTDKPLRRYFTNASLVDSIELISGSLNILGGAAGLDHAQGDFGTRSAVLFEIPPGEHTLTVAVTHGFRPVINFWRLYSEEEFQDNLRERDLLMMFFWGIALSLLFYSYSLFRALEYVAFKYYSVGYFGVFVYIVQLMGFFPSYVPALVGRILLNTSPLVFGMMLGAYWMFVSRLIHLSFERDRGWWRFVWANVWLSVPACLASFALGNFYTYMSVWVIIQFSLIFTFIVVNRARMQRIWFWALLCHLFLAAPLLIWGAVLIVDKSRSVDWFVPAVLLTITMFLVIMCVVAGLYARDNADQTARLGQSVSIGRSVQDLLLPKNQLKRVGRLEFLSHYEPFRNELSGDWIQFWTTKDGASHFLIGDVTGKGLQAALAVSMITNIVSEIIAEDGSAIRALESINSYLFGMFAGKVTTAATAATVYPESHVILYNAAGLGWAVLGQNGVRHILGRSGLLGLFAVLPLEGSRHELVDGEVLLAYTDGVAPVPRVVIQLLRQLSTKATQGESLAVLCHDLLQLSRVRGANDDRAVLVIRPRAA